MYNVIEDLKLDKLFLVNRGTRRVNLTDNIEALPAGQILSVKF